MKSLVLVASVLLQGAVAQECADGQCAAVTDDAEEMKVSLLQARQRRGLKEEEDPETAEGGEVEVEEDPAAADDADPVPSTGAQYSVPVGEDDVWSDFEEDDTEDDQVPHPKERQWSYSTANCAAYGCGNYKRGRNCQCNSKCSSYNSCCTDYKELCDHAQTTTTTTTTAAAQETEADETPAAGGASEVAGVYGHPSAKINYPKYEGFTLTLAEEFDVPIDLEHDKVWTWSDGGLREGSVRFVKEMISFEKGKMVITVSNKRPYPRMQSCSMAAKEHVGYKPLVSGELRSRHNMFRYGMYEVRMKAPEVQPGNPNINGNFIATMFVYRDANAHHWREIDFELTADRANSLTTNLLFADGTKNWRAYLQDSRKPYLGNVNIRKDFHTYRFEWVPSGVTWYFDDKVIRKGTRLKTPDQSCKIMLNTWIFSGGGFGGGAVYNNRYPMRTEYEYFRFYKWDGEKKYPCAGMSTSCLTEDDKYLSTNNPCDGIPQVGRIYGQSVCKATCHK